MTLKDAFKNFTIEETIDEPEYEGAEVVEYNFLYDVPYGYADEEEGWKDNYELFLTNLQAIATEKDWDIIENREVDEYLLNLIKENDGGELFESSIFQTILESAYLTSKGIDYNELGADEFDDLWEDEKNYTVTFHDFNFSFTIDYDIDLT